jgi:hypothetical protein
LKIVIDEFDRNLIEKLLNKNPKNRINIQQALQELKDVTTGND